MPRSPLASASILAGAFREATSTRSRLFSCCSSLKSLEEGLAGLLGLLRLGGRGAVISFHSLEDRIVKSSFRAAALGCTCPIGLPGCVCGRVPQFKVLTGKPVRASEEEIAGNPRSRSARLRVVEKII